LDRGLASLRTRIYLILIPTIIFSAYLLTERDFLGLLTVSSVSGIFVTIILYYGRKRVPTRIDETLVSLLLHMYAVSQGEAGPDDLVRVISETKDYGYYSEVFSKIRTLARKFGYGFTKATSQIAGTVKPPLKDILVRCTEVFSTTDPKGYLELEVSTMVEEYSGYYLRSIESIKVLGGIFSTFQSVAVFIVMTLDILTVFTSDPNMVYYSYIISSISLIVLFFGFRAVVPKEKLLHINRDEPPTLYKMFKLTTPISFACAAPAIIVGLMMGPAYGFIVLGAAFLFPGIFAYKLESFVIKIDEHYPTFIKCLGENMASTSSLKSALSYVLFMELGPLKNMLKKALTRIKIGISNEKSLSLFSSEAASHRVYMTNKMFLDAVNYGGDPLEVGKILGNNCVRLLEFRKRRSSVAKSFEAVILVLQPITVALLVILTYLCQFFSLNLTSLPYFTFGEIPVAIIEMGNVFLILFITALNAFALKEAKGGFWGSSLLYVGILLILSGAAWISAEKLMDIAFGQVLKGFEEFI